MKKEEIEKQIKEILAKRLNISLEKISLESNLIEDLGMDSFGAVELIFEIKDKFGIEIPDDAFKNIRQVKDIISYLLRQEETR